MSDDLIHEMSTRLGRTGPEVEKAFAAFASALQDRVRSDGQANLAGLGIIRKEPGGPRFEPSDALHQAVNYRWLSAGSPIASAPERPAASAPERPAAMLSVVPPAESAAPDPISVDLSPELLEEPPMPDDQKPIRKVSWAPLDQVDPTDLSGLPKAPAPKKVAGSAPIAAVPTASAPVPVSPVPPPPMEAFMPPVPPVETRSPPPPPSGAPEDSLVDDLTYESLYQKTSSAEAPAAVAAGAVGTAAVSGRPASRRSGPPRRSGSANASNRKPLFIIFGVLAIVLVGWILINQFGGESVTPDPAIAETETAAADPGGEAGDPEAAPAGASTNPSGTADEQSPQPSTTAGASSTSSIDPLSSGYTLMVGSSLNLSGAEADMNRFRSLGHPVALLSYPDGDGQTRHRIAVGEFATAGEADSARRAMADRLPEGTWVRRIRR
ncbi:MAG: hypothetical protein ACI9W4_002433 [Rhodothermales bacterium]|jgi:hypothetical protein